MSKSLGDLMQETLMEEIKAYEFDAYVVKYMPYDCKFCGRRRVELWTDDKQICEKCGRNQDTGEYESRSDV